MENIEKNENFVATEAAENVEQTTEQTPQEKTFTQSEVTEMMGKRVARTEAKIRKEYEKKFGDLEDVLRAGTGKENVEEITDSLKEYYQNKGFKLPEKPKYSQKDIELLARADADEIIGLGDDEVLEEVGRLSKINPDKMTDREKAAFKILSAHRHNVERNRELSKLGVTEEVYGSKEFREFAAKFSESTPISDVWDIYQKTQPKKEFKTMGSMKNTSATDEGIKDFYTPDEAKRFTVEDFDRNPALFERVEASMKRWK